ncbi:MAG: DUF4390 domain-containing protein [Pseudomonadota bacterium]|nr:DUF4390 domain-containing protein [Pseudomonadota bacterium]
MPSVTSSAFGHRSRRALRCAAHVRHGFTFLLACAVLFCGTVWADTITVLSAEVRTEEEGYYLNAEFDLSINSTLEEALQKGVALYFVLELDVTRPRWYWFDDKIVTYSTQYRVSYVPLTRQYRISSGLLNQNFESLEEVQRLLSRVTSRQIARRDQLPRGSRLEAALRLRLDTNQLPKPFQVNALASREWSLQSDWYRFGFTS